MTKAQSVVLSQPFMSSQFLSPASVGNGLYGGRIQSNIKTQMLDGQNLFKTIVVGYDTRIIASEYSNSYLGVGGQIISDQVMNGVMKFNTIGLNMAYHIFLDNNLNKNLSLGLGVIYNESIIDRTNLRFGDQYDYTAQLTGLASLDKLLPTPSSTSASASALFTSHNETSFLQAGITSFFFQKPNLTSSVFNVAPENKYRFFSNVEFPFLESYVIALHGNYLYQNTKNQYNLGASIGIPISKYDDEVKRMYFGLYYRGSEALVPTVSLISNKYIFGLSYDVFNTNKTSSNIRTNSYELSLSMSLGRKRSNLFRTIFD